MSTTSGDREFQLECQIDALEQAACTLLEVVVMRRAEFADAGIDSALRTAIHELGVVIFELGGIEAMRSVAHEGSIDAPPNNALRATYLDRAWRGIGDQRGGWLR